MDIDESEEKRPTVQRSETLESSLTEESEARRGSKSKTVAIAATFGIAFLLGGSILLLYMNFIAMNEHQPSANAFAMQEHGEISNSSYTYDSRKFWTIAAFVLIAIGSTVVTIGSVVAAMRFVKYRLSRDSERSPILDKSPGTNLKESGPSLNMKRLAKRQKSKRRAWMKYTTRSMSREGFRFAAHRHPSVNPVSIDSSGFSFRRFSEESTTSSSEERLTAIDEPPSRETVGQFLHRIFAGDVNSKVEDRDKSAMGSEDSKDDFKFSSARNSEDYTERSEGCLCRLAETDSSRPTTPQNSLHESD